MGVVSHASNPNIWEISASGPPIQVWSWDSVSNWTHTGHNWRRKRFCDGRKKPLGSEWREMWLLCRSSSIPQCGILHKDNLAEELNTWPFKMCLIKWQLASPVLWSMILIPLIHQHWRALALHQALSAVLGSHSHENQPVCRAWRTEDTQTQG